MSKTKEITIGGVLVPISIPYEEGHICSEAEAKALVQVRNENIANNCRKFVDNLNEREKKGDANIFSGEALQKIADHIKQYDKGYKFTNASIGGGRKPKDPLERMQNTVAREHVASKIKKAGNMVKDYTKEQIAEFVAQIIGHAEVIKLAKMRLKSEDSLNSLELENLAN